MVHDVGITVDKIGSGHWGPKKKPSKWLVWSGSLSPPGVIIQVSLKALTMDTISKGNNYLLEDIERGGAAFAP